MRLDPYEAADLPGLWAALGRPEVFAGGWGGGPAAYRADEAEFGAWLAGYLPHERGGNAYTVRIASGPHAGRVVGTTSLADFDEPNEAAHIGWTAYAPEVWATQVNAEAKLLLLSLAFDHGYGRVKLQADVRNERSRAAIARLGAVSEGITRRHMRRADGSWRDSAVFSVTIDDWSAVRAGLEERLARFGDAPVELRERPAG